MKVIVNSLFYLVLLSSLSLPANAGGFAESFKNWVLDADTQIVEANTQIVEALAATPRLDPVSAGCMSCHGGDHALGIVIKSADAPLQFTSSGHQSNHPVGMNYEKYAAGLPSGFHPRAGLNPGINLVNGQVGCGTCHQQKSRSTPAHGAESAQVMRLAAADSSDPGQRCTSTSALTVGPRTSDLCMACHAM
jgi:formate-dependent nitrite reductase cytochrome c552 subunit